MAQLNESEIRQIQVLFSYSTTQLQPNSYLRQRIKVVEENDVRFGLTVIDEIKTNLQAIADLETKIDDIKASGADSLKREDINQEYEIEYKLGVDAAAGFKEQRAKLLQRIALDLDLYRIKHSGRKLRS